MKILLVLMMMLSSFGVMARGHFTSKSDVNDDSPGCGKVKQAKSKKGGFKAEDKRKYFFCYRCKKGLTATKEEELIDDVPVIKKTDGSKHFDTLRSPHVVCEKPVKEKKFFYCDPSSKEVVEVVAADEAEASTKSNGNKIYKKERKAKKDPNCKVVKVACTVADPIGSFLKDAQLDKKQVKDYKKACKAEKKNFDREGDVCSCKAEPVKVACTVADAIGSFAKDAQLSKDQVKDYKKACQAEKKKFKRDGDICLCQGQAPACTVVDAIGSFAKDAQLGKKEVKEYKRACKAEKGSFSRDKDAKTCGCTKGSEPKFFVCVPGTKDEIREITGKNEKKAKKAAGLDRKSKVYSSRDEAVANFGKDCPVKGEEKSLSCYFCDPNSGDAVDISSLAEGNDQKALWNKLVKNETKCEDITRKHLKKIFTKPVYLGLEKMFNDADNYYSKGLGAKLTGNGKKLFKRVKKAPLFSSGAEAKARYSQVGTHEINKCVPPPEKQKRDCQEMYGVASGVVTLTGEYKSSDEAIAAIQKLNNGKISDSPAVNGDVVSLVVEDEKGEKCGWTATVTQKMSCEEVRKGISSISECKDTFKFQSESYEDVLSQLQIKKNEWKKCYEDKKALFSPALMSYVDNNFSAEIKMNLDGQECGVRKLVAANEVLKLKFEWVSAFKWDDKFNYFADCKKIVIEKLFSDFAFITAKVSESHNKEMINAKTVQAKEKFLEKYLVATSSVQKGYVWVLINEKGCSVNKSSKPLEERGNWNPKGNTLGGGNKDTGVCTIDGNCD